MGHRCVVTNTQGSWSQWLHCQKKMAAWCPLRWAALAALLAVAALSEKDGSVVPTQVSCTACGGLAPSTFLAQWCMHTCRHAHTHTHTHTYVYTHTHTLTCIVETTSYNVCCYTARCKCFIWSVNEVVNFPEHRFWTVMIIMNTGSELSWSSLMIICIHYQYHEDNQAHWFKEENEKEEEMKENSNHCHLHHVTVSWGIIYAGS